MVLHGKAALYHLCRPCVRHDTLYTVSEWGMKSPLTPIKHSARFFTNNTYVLCITVRVSVLDRYQSVAHAADDLNDHTIELIKWHFQVLVLILFSYKPT